MQTTAEIQELLEKYLGDRMTQSEMLRFKTSLQEDANNTIVAELVEEVLSQQRYNDLSGADRRELFDRLMQEANRRSISLRVQPAHRVHFLKTSWFRYAAAVVVLLGGVGSYFWLSERQPSTVATTNGNKPLQADIAPGTNRAVLTVGDQVIDLSSNKTGIAVGNAITYNDGERIAEAGQLLQLTTPRGGQYQAVLPDGSRVWLNAASSIKFPSSFKGDSREIEITGEAYLEVAQNVKQSFVVKAAGAEIRVLGTSFNVNAYSDENVLKTTLIDGSVKVLAHAKETILRPGQQAQIINDQLLVVNDQSEAALAWKNGIFNFNGADLRSVMRQLERWYDIKVQYQSSIPGIVFKGRMYRNVSFSDVLDMLRRMGVKFRMEDKTLVVL